MQLISRFLKHITKSHTLDTVKDIGRFPHINQRLENGLRVRTNIRAGVITPNIIDPSGEINVDIPDFFYVDS